MARPLEINRVLKLGNLIAGPFCGMLLGDMGADVITMGAHNAFALTPGKCRYTLSRL